MIKANELRIGNYILINSKISKIFNVSDEGVNMVIDTLGHFPINEFEKLSDCTAIPLTPEILEKCGFKRDTVYFYRYSIGSFNIHKTLKDFKKADTKENRCFRLALDLGEFLKTEIQYLHQLQNLYFALTGEELNVKL